jgi:alpha-1,2-mannosyltransferase
MIRARSAHADGDEVTAFTLVGLSGAIVGPVSDTHELVWVLPALLILVDAAARQRAMSRRPRPGPNDRFLSAGYAAAAALTYLVFVAAPVWAFGHAGGPAGMIGGNAYALALILLVSALPWRPGVAPAFPINRWAKQVRRQPRAVPPAPATGS